MLNMGGGEFIMVAILALLLVKPEKLPHLATTLGRWFAELQRSFNEVRSDFEVSLKEKPNKPPLENKTEPHSEPPQNTK